jgi:uncharacterized protein (TIGR03792 family)
MVIEFLTFDVPVDRRDAWMEREEAVWSRFLEAQPGFVRKELWGSDDEGDEGTVHAVIWWESTDQWKAIGPETVAGVDALMGDLLIEPTCRSWRVLREC